MTEAKLEDHLRKKCMNTKKNHNKSNYENSDLKNIINLIKTKSKYYILKTKVVN